MSQAPCMQLLQSICSVLRSSQATCLPRSQFSTQQPHARRPRHGKEQNCQTRNLLFSLTVYILIYRKEFAIKFKRLSSGCSVGYFWQIIKAWKKKVLIIIFFFFAFKDPELSKLSGWKTRKTWAAFIPWFLKITLPISPTRKTANLIFFARVK